MLCHRARCVTGHPKRGYMSRNTFQDTANIIEMFYLNSVPNSSRPGLKAPPLFLCPGTVTARFCILIQGVDNPEQALLRPAPTLTPIFTYRSKYAVGCYLRYRWFPRRTLLGSLVNRGTPCILVRFFSRSPTRPASQPRPLPTAAPLAMEDIDPALLLIASKISSRLVEVLSTPTAPAPKARSIPEGVKTLLLSTNATASP